jgi:hypothetical protein
MANPADVLARVVDEREEFRQAAQSLLSREGDRYRAVLNLTDAFDRLKALIRDAGARAHLDATLGRSLSELRELFGIA